MGCRCLLGRYQKSIKTSNQKLVKQNPAFHIQMGVPVKVNIDEPGLPCPFVELNTIPSAFEAGFIKCFHLDGRLELFIKNQIHHQRIVLASGRVVFDGMLT